MGEERSNHYPKVFPGAGGRPFGTYGSYQISWQDGTGKNRRDSFKSKIYPSVTGGRKRHRQPCSLNQDLM